MNLFNKLPGFVQSALGLEPLILGRLPAILLWGTLLPLVLAVALGYFVVRVMKGPAFVADAYPLPDNNAASTTRP